METKNGVRKEAIAASEVLFIKLGKGGEWEAYCIEGQNPCIRLGFDSRQHNDCLVGNWEPVKEYWDTKGRPDAINQIKAFYTADEQTLWITFYQRKLWWCFANRHLEELADGTRIRKTLGPWSCKDLSGKDLRVDSLSGLLTKVRGFRGTICKFREGDPLLRRLNGTLGPDVENTIECLKRLQLAVGQTISLLNPKDFELLCDLILTRAGWQRISPCGKTEKLIDMAFLQPVSKARALVQVKSEADLNTFLEWKEKFEALNDDAEAYFIVHKPTADLAAYEIDESISLLTADRLAELVVSAGLTQWLIQKIS